LNRVGPLAAGTVAYGVVAVVLGDVGSAVVAVVVAVAIGLVARHVRRPAGPDRRLGRSIMTAGVLAHSGLGRSLAWTIIGVLVGVVAAVLVGMILIAPGHGLALAAGVIVGLAVAAICRSRRHTTGPPGPGPVGS
jgi:hypothetical protein